MQRKPLAIYQSLLANGNYKSDPEQHRVVCELDRVWSELTTHPVRGWWSKVRGKQLEPVRGLYLWGDVGRGKTWLMDLFFDALPRQDKLRIHFHRFMARVHAALRALPATRDPLPHIACQWASQCQVLCLDEFFVADIADAMLLGGLLEALFEAGVTLIATSNVPPDKLYENGLQRTRFQPAIATLKQHTQSVHVDGARDYRLRILQRSVTYLQPLGASAESSLANAFSRMAGESMEARSSIHGLTVNGRVIAVRRRAHGIVWFSFAALCEQARSSSDYTEIAQAFNTVLLSGVPRMGETALDAVRRFINLIDEFYDHNVKILISAAAPINEIYTGNRLAFEFQRTTSRLTEMQSNAYLSRPHLR